MNISKEKIKLIMAKKELSVTDIAKRCNKSKQRISCIINSVSVTPKTVALICKALECDVTEILED